MEKNLDAQPESGKEFYHDFHNKGKVIMINLLKFRSKADYTNLDSLMPGEGVIGEQSYQLYMDNTLPELKKSGKVFCSMETVKFF